MKTGLLIVRSCVGWGRGCTPAASLHHRHRPSLFVPAPASIPAAHPRDAFRPSSSGQAARPLSSFSSSSFEAPEPPSSHGQPVFPDVRFGADAAAREDTREAAVERNADEGAVFVVNGSSRGIGLQFVKSLVERAKVSVNPCANALGGLFAQFVLLFMHFLR